MIKKTNKYHVTSSKKCHLLKNYTSKLVRVRYVFIEEFDHTGHNLRSEIKEVEMELPEVLAPKM